MRGWDKFSSNLRAAVQKFNCPGAPVYGIWPPSPPPLRLSVWCVVKDTEEIVRDVIWTPALSQHLLVKLLKLNVWWSVQGLRFEGRKCRVTLMADVGPVWRRINGWSPLRRLRTVVKIQWSASSPDRFTAGTHWIGGLRVIFIDTNRVGAFLSAAGRILAGQCYSVNHTTVCIMLPVLTMLAYWLHGAESFLRS
jgi:hypothetical protein